MFKLKCFFFFLFLTQEEIDKMVETTELMTGNIQSLKNKIQILASEVEEEEERIKQVIILNCITGIWI